MSVDSIIIPKFLNDDSIVNIKEKINKLMDSSFSNFNSIVTILPDIVIKTEDLKIYKLSFLQVAKLSINLFIDFSYYKRFQFKETFTDFFYKERLNILGYGCRNGIWKYTATLEPNRSVIHENIFLYHLICQLLESKVRKKNLSGDIDEQIPVSRTISKRSNDIDFPSVEESSDIDEPILVSRSGNITRSNQGNKIDNSLARLEILDKEKNSQNDNKNELILESFGAKSRESWICKQCTFVNDIDLNNCGTCFLSNDPLEESSSISLTIPPDETAIDSEIDLENSIKNFVVLPKSVISYWICPNCTFQNKSDRLNCETCLASIGMNTPIISEDLPHSLQNSIENLKSKFSSLNGNVEEISVDNLDLQNLNYSIDEKIVNHNNGTILPNCLKCKKPIDKTQQKYLCDVCSESYVVCCNEACTQLYKTKKIFCQKCKVRKNSDMKNGNLFEVNAFWIFNKKRWQCSFCFRFNTNDHNKCKKCHNSRYNIDNV